MDLSPRISSLLSEAIKFQVTEVVAPSGFGKSTLLSYLESTYQFEVARLRPMTEPRLELLRGLCQAVSDFAPEAASVLPMAYRNAQKASPTDELTNWFCDWLPRRQLHIALDDLHHLADDPDAWSLLAAIVGHPRAANVKWILCSRTWLRIPIVEWVARGFQGPSIRESDLAFTESDVAYAADSLGLQVSADAAAALARAARGWPMLIFYGLRLCSKGTALTNAIESLKGRGADSIVTTVLDRISDGEIELLISIALLDGALPERLQALNPFALKSIRNMVKDGVPLLQDGDRRWRLHDLFREHLLSRELQFCTKVAHDLTIDAENPDEALRIALASRSTQLLRRVLEEKVEYFCDTPDFELIQRAVASLPNSSIDSSYKLSLLKGVLEIRKGQSEVGVIYLRRAAEASPREERTYALARMGHALINWPGHAAEGIDLLCNALSEPLPARLEQRCDVLARVAYGPALSGQIDLALSLIEEALKLLPRISAPVVAVRALISAGQVSWIAGRPELAQMYSSRAIAVCEDMQLFEPLVIALDLAKNIAARSDEAQNEELLRKQAQYAATTLDSAVLYYANVALFMLACRAGRIDEARDLRHRLMPVPEKYRPRIQASVLLPAALLAMLERRLDSAAHMLDQITTLGEDALQAEMIPVRQAMTMGCFAIVSHMSLQGDVAVSRARQCLSICANVLLSGATLSATPELEIAKICSAAILALNGYLSEAEPVLDDMVENATELYRRDLARWVLDALNDPAAEPSAEARARANGIITLIQRCFAGAQAVTLTPTERRVLEAIALGRTTKEVASSLGRSTKTVDNHVTSILRKLNARNRNEAVARARRNGILDLERDAPIPV